VKIVTFTLEIKINKMYNFTNMEDMKNMRVLRRPENKIKLGR